MKGIGRRHPVHALCPMLAARGARIILVVQDALCPLLVGDGRCRACLPAIRPGAAGLRFPCALCRACRPPSAPGSRRSPPRTPISAPPVERVRVWEKRLGMHDQIYGSASSESGNPNTTMTATGRSRLRLLAPILEHIDATFISLQKEPRPTTGRFSMQRRRLSTSPPISPILPRPRR